MINGPKKVWIDYNPYTESYGETESEDSGGSTEYTRSDIAQARIDKLEAQAVGFRESIRKALMDSKDGHTILDICWEAYFPQEKVEDG
jgi:hypothetical protein